MTKKEYHQTINGKFYEFINKKFPYYEIHLEDGGRVSLINEKKPHLQITYHQSSHWVLPSVGYENQLKFDVVIMEEEIEDIKRHINVI